MEESLTKRSRNDPRKVKDANGGKKTVTPNSQTPRRNLAPPYQARRTAEKGGGEGIKATRMGAKT